MTEFELLVDLHLGTARHSAYYSYGFYLARRPV
jgi:hypothetical protein